MFDLFTEGALKTMGLARGEADRLRHDYVGAEHILLALPDADVCAASLLSALGISRERLRAAVENEVAPGTLRTRPNQIPFTQEAKEVLESAMAASQAGQSACVKTMDLVLGMVGAARPTSPACRALTTLGLRDVSTVRSAILQLEL